MKKLLFAYVIGCKKEAFETIYNITDDIERHTACIYLQERMFARNVPESIVEWVLDMVW